MAWMEWSEVRVIPSERAFTVIPSERSECAVIPSERSESRDLHLVSLSTAVPG